MTLPRAPVATRVRALLAIGFCGFVLAGSGVEANPWADRLGRRLEIQTFGTGVAIENDFLAGVAGVPRRQAGLDIRPNLDLDLDPLRLWFKPRWELRWTETPSGNELRQGEIFIQEWTAQLRLGNTLLASFGREDLQWGPSYLISPSNPFHSGNGQSNPRVEVPGLDYGQLAWIPGYRWTFSAMANTSKGRAETLLSFEKTYALKADYTGDAKFASALISIRETEDRATIGAYGGWNVSDALLVYGEASISESIKTARLLAGGSYTFDRGWFLAVEFFRNGGGCDRTSYVSCFLPPGEPADPNDILIRRHYLLVQATHPDLPGGAEATIRMTAGLDDSSSRWVGIYRLPISDHLFAFAVGDLEWGETGDEFGAVVSSALMAGLSLVF